MKTCSKGTFSVLTLDDNQIEVDKYLLVSVFLVGEFCEPGILFTCLMAFNKEKKC